MKTILSRQILIGIVLGLALLSSCIPSDQTATLTVIPVKFNLPPVAATRTFTVKSSESWFMEQIGEEDWCTVYPDKSTPGDTQITLTVSPLPNEMPRTAIFSIKSVSGQEKFLTVEQTNATASSYFFDFFGDPDPSFYIYPRDVEPLKLLVFTNVPQWDVAVSSGAEQWISAQRDKDTLLVTIADIDRPAGRTGSITAFAGGSLSATLTFSQMGLHDYGAPTEDFTLSVPGVPDSELAFSYVYRRARITMLYMWGSWCTDCKNFMPKVKELYEEFAPHGFKIYGAALEIEGREQEYFDYLAANGLEDVDQETGNKIWWENRPVFNPLEARKVNEFSRMFYGDALMTGEVMNFVPAFIFVDGGGNVKKVYVDNYVLRTDAAINSLYRNMRTFLSRQLECCGG